MKFKVGQMVRAKDSGAFSEGELLKIIKLNHYDGSYLCKGEVHWQGEDDLEPAPQTLEDKLELFKAGTHVLYTSTQEIYDKLMVELEKRGYVWRDGQPMTTYSFTDAGYGRKVCAIVTGRIPTIDDPIDHEQLIRDTLQVQPTYVEVPKGFDAALSRAMVLTDIETVPTIITVEAKRLRLVTTTSIGVVRD